MRSLVNLTQEEGQGHAIKVVFASLAGVIS